MEDTASLANSIADTARKKNNRDCRADRYPSEQYCRMNHVLRPTGQYCTVQCCGGYHQKDDRRSSLSEVHVSSCDKIVGLPSLPSDRSLLARFLDLTFIRFHGSLKTHHAWKPGVYTSTNEGRASDHCRVTEGGSESDPSGWSRKRHKPPPSPCAIASKARKQYLHRAAKLLIAARCCMLVR